MVFPVIEPLHGLVDGTNVIFETNVPYLAGSVRVFVNGQLKTKALQDGWVELGGKKIRMLEAPKAFPRFPDVLQAYYIPL